MSKRSNKGKAYFYAKGQRDAINFPDLTANKLKSNRKKLKPHAHSAWIAGYFGF